MNKLKRSDIGIQIMNKKDILDMVLYDLTVYVPKRNDKKFQEWLLDEGDEQRFTIQTDDKGFNYCVQDNGKDLSDVELLHLLNKLYEENELFKQILKQSDEGFFDDYFNGVAKSFEDVMN